jgi:hypothetical protein
MEYKKDAINPNIGKYGVEVINKLSTNYQQSALSAVIKVTVNRNKSHRKS